MSDNPTDPPVHELADLNVATIRRENDAVDEQLTSLESEASDLREEISDLETERDDLEEEAEKAKKLLKEFHDSQREDQLARIRAANEAVEDDDEVDLSTLEDASVDQLETVAEMLENVAGADVTVSNEEADLDVVEGGEKTLEDELAEVAEDNGLSRQYEAIQNGESTRFEIGEAGESNDEHNAPEAGFERGQNGGVPMDDIVNALGDD